LPEGALVVEQVLSDGRVPARGGVRQVEDQREVQRVWSDGERLMQDPVLADAVEVDAMEAQLEVEVALADGRDSKGGLLGDQDVPVGRVRPGGAALLEPGSQGTVGQLAEPLDVAGDVDAPVGQVEVVQQEVPDGGDAGGVDGRRATISRCAGLMATCWTARISASVIGSRLGSMRVVARWMVGLAKTRPRFLAERNSDRRAVVALRRWDHWA
jgi:hypothetical protein